MGKARATQTIQEGAPRSSGVGESTPHAAVFTDPGHFEEGLDSPFHLANCTIGGEPIPEHLWSKVVYAQTDQGMADRGVDPDKSGGVEIIRDEVHNGIRRRGDDLDRGLRNGNSSGVVTSELVERGILEDEAFDERRELVLRHVPPGHRAKFLAKDRVGSGGIGANGYVICRDDNGDPVRHGSSILGYIPEERAAAIQRRFEDKSKTAQAEMYDNDLLQQERVLRGGTPLGRFERPDPGDAVLGLQSDLGGDELSA